MTRYCPKCGEPVPPNSLTCPKCYAKIPAEPVKKESRSQDSGGPGRSNNGRVRMALAIIPGFFGILGLGQIYRNYRQLKGYIFLVLGLVFFVSGNVLLLSIVPELLVGILKTVVGVGLLLIYLILFFISVIDALASFNVVVRG